MEHLRKQLEAEIRQQLEVEIRQQLEVEIRQQLEKNKTEEKIQEEQKSEIQKYLKNKIAFFSENSHIFLDLEDPEKSTKLIAGLVQSGKSNVICGLVLYINKALKNDVVIIVRDITADYEQLHAKFTRDFSEYRLTINYTANTPLDNIFLENHPKITIALEHEKQLDKIKIACEQNPETMFYLIADEADAVCYKDSKYQNPTRNTLFNMIKKRAEQFIGVTATAFDMLYMENELYSDCIYKVPIDPKYKGIDHPDFSITELKRTFDFKMQDTENPAIWKFSKDMQRFYNQIANIPIFEEKTENGIFTHPVMCLQTTETEIKKQLQCLGAFARHPVFKKEFTVIVYNGDGVFVYSPNGVDREVKGFDANDKKYVLFKAKTPTSPYLEDCNGVMYFKKLMLSDMLQYLKDRHDPPNRIVIIAGLLVGRGINVVSRDYQWHLTHQILKMSDTATCSDLIQKIRLLGIYRDTIPTQLFCVQKDAVSIRQAHKLQNRIYEGASLYEELEIMPNLCEQIKMFVGNIPRRRTTKKCAEPHWNQVSKEQEQYGEVVEEEKEQVYSGIYKILPERMANISRGYYDRIIEYLEKSLQKNKWLKKSELIKKIAQHQKDSEILKNATWHWFSKDNKYTEHAETEKESGLLLKKVQDEYYFRLN